MVIDVRGLDMMFQWYLSLDQRRASVPIGLIRSHGRPASPSRIYRLEWYVIFLYCGKKWPNVAERGEKWQIERLMDLVQS